MRKRPGFIENTPSVPRSAWFSRYARERFIIRHGRPELFAHELHDGIRKSGFRPRESDGIALPCRRSA